MLERNSGLIFAGVSLIVVGVMSLVSIWTGVNWFSLFCPGMLILLGIWMLIKPRQMGFVGDANITFIGEVERSGQWQPTGESFLAFIGDYDLDLTKAEIATGETSYSFTSFITDADVLLPADVGVRVTGTGFISEIKLSGHKEESFIAPVTWESENYPSAERKIRIDSLGFINEVRVRQL